MVRRRLVPQSGGLLAKEGFPGTWRWMFEVHHGANEPTKAPSGVDAPTARRKVGPLARARRAMLPDARLAKEAARGDLDAFEAIFRRYQDDLYRFCVGILREPQDAQDAVQNTMFKAMRALPGERRDMELKPWLYRIAHNEAVELRRRERPAVELTETVDAVAGAEQRAEDNLRLRMLLADIADLPDRQRASLVMREVNGLGFGEISAALGTSPGAVRQALYEARRALAEMDHGRDMHCDLAMRMVSDAAGRPRDRSVRAHLRGCSPCRRFQDEIRGRGRTLAAISPMPAIAAVVALKAALASGTAAGGSGAAVAAGGAGTAAGVAAGSVGATALLKPAVGLLAVLAIGTAAVDQHAIFPASRQDPSTAGHRGSVHGVAASGGRSSSRASQEIVRHTGKARAAVGRSGARTDPSSQPGASEPDASLVADRPGLDLQGEAVAGMGDEQPPALDGAVHEEALLPGVQVPTLSADGGGQPRATMAGAEEPGAGDGNADQTGDPEGAPEGAEPVGDTAPADPETSADMPPGQREEEDGPPARTENESGATAEPAATVGAAAHVPPGQTKNEASSPATTVVEAGVRASPAPVEKAGGALGVAPGERSDPAPTTEGPGGPPVQVEEGGAMSE